VAIERQYSDRSSQWLPGAKNTTPLFELNRMRVMVKEDGWIAVGFIFLVSTIIAFGLMAGRCSLRIGVLSTITPYFRSWVPINTYRCLTSFTLSLPRTKLANALVRNFYCVALVALKQICWNLAWRRTFASSLVSTFLGRRLGKTWSF
jgi:hypothetical protein